MVDIAPSLLSADFARLGEELKAIETGGASLLHFDVMDGRFVPNLTMGLPVLKSLSRITRLPIDAHLMIEEPGRYVEQFVEAGAQMVSIHAEAEPHLHRALMAVKAKGAQAGVALNPLTPLNMIEEALAFVDYVVVMSVNPGFGGQKFIPTALNKVRRLRQMIEERRAPVRIEVDGGVDAHNIADVVRAGADILVAGSAVFGREDAAQAVRELREKATLWI